MQELGRESELDMFQEQEKADGQGLSGRQQGRKTNRASLRGPHRRKPQKQIIQVTERNNGVGRGAVGGGGRRD